MGHWIDVHVLMSPITAQGAENLLKVHFIKGGAEVVNFYKGQDGIRSINGSLPQFYFLKTISNREFEL